jgi:indolepyruvate ferredoxin oxidoreductase
MILGYAWQKGWVPLRRESLVRAIELNDVQVKNNLAAFEWGRHAAHQLNALMKSIQPAQVVQFKKRESLETLIADRMTRLTDYQDKDYALLYQGIVAQVQAAEAPLGKTLLSDTVARQLYRLMAYKDEYEVARLHSDPAFRQKLEAQFEGPFKLRFHLAPPLLAKRDPATGELRKAEYGPWVMSAFKVLARLRFLRGTALDVFGYTHERRTERALIGEYEAAIAELLARLEPGNHGLAVRIASIPEEIRGYGHVKERHLAAARSKQAELRAQFLAPVEPGRAAA